MQKKYNYNPLEILNTYEARAMRSQPDIVWSKASGEIVFDIFGGEYIDFSSGVMIANSGHGCPEIVAAISKCIKKGLYASYTFPTMEKAELLCTMSKIIPENYKIALFSAGSESAEAAIKIARIFGKNNNKSSKNIIISYINSYHGQSLGAQSISGTSNSKQWIPEGLDKQFVRIIPYPDNFFSNSSFDSFLDEIKKLQLKPNDISAVIIECYQGSIGKFAPKKYMKSLCKWCKDKNVLFIIDEIQSGFARTGKMWAYQHFDVVPDLFLAGKGLSSSLPISAVIAKTDIIDLCEPGTLNSTHSGNPVCCAAANANIKFIITNNLDKTAIKMGKELRLKLMAIKKKFPDRIRAVFGKGLVYALHVGDSSSNKPNPDLARNIVSEACKNGLILYNPGGPEEATIKIVPPLVISEKNLTKGCHILESAIRDA